MRKTGAALNEALDGESKNRKTDAPENLMEELRKVDRKTLVDGMAAALPEIREAIGISGGTVASKVGMGAKRYDGIEKGRLTPSWCEYMSLVFLFWNNEISRGIIEEKGLFPDAVKNALSINRNAHAPTSVMDDG